MSNLTAEIEIYLKNLFAETGEDFILLKRAALAELFSCGPSHINYVLNTRFTVRNGFLVETRRGGGGYVKIFRLQCCRDDEIEYLTGRKGLTVEEASETVGRLYDGGLLGEFERDILTELLNDNILQEEPRVRRAGLINIFLRHCGKKQNHMSGKRSGTDEG